MTGRGLLKICCVLTFGLMVCALFFISKSGSLLFAALLERSAPPLSASQARAAQAIVVLTGAKASMLEAARLHRATGLPVLASGGDGEAAAIKSHLEKNLQIPVKWSEGNSLNTEQNAKFSAEILTKVQVFKTCEQMLQFCKSFAQGKTKTNCQMRVLVLTAADWTSASV